MSHGDQASDDFKSRVEQRLFDDESAALDRFGALLALTVVSVAALSLIDLQSITSDVVRSVVAFLLSLTTGGTLVLALRAAGVVRRWRRIAEILVAIAAVLSIGGLILGLTTDVDLSAFGSTRPPTIWLLIVVLSPVAVVRRLLQHRRVTIQTLAGAVAAYLLIALAACYVFFTIDVLLDDGFFGRDVASHEFMYFSLVTITTVGYGDLSPTDPTGRLAATFEALIGQVYLVTFVAMVVGLMIQQRDQS